MDRRLEVCKEGGKEDEKEGTVSRPYITITYADKGGGIVVLNKSDYVDKIP